MPRTVVGKICFALLMIFIVQFISVIVSIFIHGLLGIIVLLYSSLFTIPLFLIFGIIGVIWEDKEKKIIPLIVLILSVVELAVYLLATFGYSFGG